MVPEHEQVKQIMNDVYNKFYLKWRRELTKDNAEQMMLEVYELDQKYPYEICSKNLVLFVECIEDEYRRRNGIN